MAECRYCQDEICSMRGKPCTMCPAVPRQERNEPLKLREKEGGIIGGL